MQDEFREYYKLIGLRVAYFRKIKEMTQAQLAEKMGVDTSFIGQIEAVNIYKPISMDTLFRLSKALEQPPYKLLLFD
ncbi:MAG: helix-turn-helix transcriptional regulator [Oscillospiraceae bacterium]|nr:helix-turn-helix transcriptional regulator [Oscillospiraceae bacterium]